jgi:hypothetical protein
VTKKPFCDTLFTIERCSIVVSGANVPLGHSDWAAHLVNPATNRAKGLGFTTHYVLCRWSAVLGDGLAVLDGGSLN